MILTNYNFRVAFWRIWGLVPVFNYASGAPYDMETDLIISSIRTLQLPNG